MADKKINQLDPAGAITANDLFVVNQDPATGIALSIAAADVRSYVLGGANAGARIFFTVGVPDNSLGVDGDVAFNVNDKIIYQKASAVFVNRTSYGSNTPNYIRFNAVYGSGGLSSDGMTYTNTDLLHAFIISVKVEADELIPVENQGDVPLFDEFDFDDTTGVFSFGSPLPAGLRITINYSI